MRQTDVPDRVILFLCCGIFSLMRHSGELNIVPVIIAAIALGLISFFDMKKNRILIGALYTLLCFFYPPLCFFLPVIMYGYFEKQYKYLFLSGLIPLLAVSEIAGEDRLLILILAIISVLLKYKAIYFVHLREKYLAQTDTMREMSIRLQKQNQNLLKKQDDEIRLATLNERNRIAREIHDNVGHQLSSALLQVGALFTVNKEIPVLLSIKDTLNMAMDSIRNSVHNLYDSSIDLDAQLKALAADFTFCDIDLNLNFETNPEPVVKYALIAIVKEAFANIMKHSDATRVCLSFIEHPGFFQLIVSDNGNVLNYHMENGIGLRNITQRVEALKGNCLIRVKNGFELFITIPRETKYELSSPK